MQTTKKPEWKNVALSVKQPWASLICYGIKDVENRTWKTNYRGRLYIVASSSKVTSWFDKRVVPSSYLAAVERKQREGILPDLHTLPQSAVIGYVDLVDCTGEKVDSIWSEGTIEDRNYNWILRDAHLFETPVFPGFKAKLGLFEIPDLDEDNLPPTRQIEY